MTYFDGEVFPFLNHIDYTLDTSKFDEEKFPHLDREAQIQLSTVRALLLPRLLRSLPVLVRKGQLDKLVFF